MVIMAGMLPGVECARRRRRLRQQGAAEAPPPVPPGTSRHANGHDRAHPSKRRGGAGACTETAVMTTASLDSNARQAKERLDQKLRSQRESVVTRHHSTGSLRLPGKPPATTSAGAGEHAASALQREVFPKERERRGGRRRRWFRFRFSWGRHAAAPEQQQQQQQQQQAAAECAVCLEEFRAGDVLVHLPCAHRFHWRCAVPWVQAASRCPLCRAAVDGAGASGELS